MPLKSYKTKIGCDIWQVSMSQKIFFNLCKKHHLEIYNIQCQKGFIQFSAPIYLRFKILKCFEKIEYIKSDGYGALLIRLFRWHRILIMMVCVCLLYQLPHFVFKIYYRGDTIGKNIIRKKLDEHYGKLPYYECDEFVIEQLCYQDFSWVDVSKKGAVLEIAYKRPVDSQPKSRTGTQIIAKKRGVLSHYEVYSGVKKVPLHQVVNEGDVLVDGIIVDTSQKSHSTQVYAKVYAKTWEEVKVSINAQHEPNALDLFRLLLFARNELYQDFSDDDQILKENILHFSRNNDKIELYVQYELLQNIAVLQE